MSNPIPVMSVLRVLEDKLGHVYVPTTDQYYPYGNDANSDELNTIRQAQSDEAPCQPIQSEPRKDVAPPARLTSPKRRPD